MAFTGVLGTNASQPGNFVLGLGIAQSGNLSVGVFETLDFVEVASYPTVPVSASDTLAFVESAIAGRRIPVTVSEAITFGESQPVIGPRYEAAANNLIFSESVVGHLSTVTKLVSEGLILIESVGRHVPVSVAEVLALVDTTRPPAKIADVLALIEAVLVAKAASSGDMIALAEAASILGTFHRSATDVMAIVEAAGHFITNPSLECTYSPFIGASNGAYTPPSATPPTFGAGTLTLTWPYASPTTTLVLRNPELGDEDKLTYNRLNQTTRGGSLTVFADPQWPKFKTRSFQVIGIPDDQRDTLLQFLENSLGQEIGLLDWDGRQWRGIITNPDTAVTQAGRCNHQVSIEFEGELA